MFFIVPEVKASDQPPSPPLSASSSPRPAKRQRLSPEADDQSGYYPKRTPKACDRCRLKKARCQWSQGKICDKCKRDGVICTTNRESKREPKAPNAAYVQLVESQRDSLLQAIRKILEDGLMNDQAELAKTLQDFGIRPDALKKVSRRPPEQQYTPANLDYEAGIYQNDCEIHALSDSCNAGTATVIPAAPSLTIPATGGTQPECYFSLPYSDLFLSNDPLPTSSTEAGSSLDTMLLPSLDMADWLVSNPAEDNWPSSSNVDLVAG